LFTLKIRIQPKSEEQPKSSTQ